jgi:hypothetical protein
LSGLVAAERAARVAALEAARRKSKAEAESREPMREGSSNTGLLTRENVLEYGGVSGLCTLSTTPGTKSGPPELSFVSPVSAGCGGWPSPGGGGSGVFFVVLYAWCSPARAAAPTPTASASRARPVLLCLRAGRRGPPLRRLVRPRAPPVTRTFSSLCVLCCEPIFYFKSRIKNLT